MTAIRTAIGKLRAFFYTSQEFTLWLPGMLLLAVLSYVVLGGIVRLGGDSLAWLSELPARCAYVAAWLGSTWAVKSLYMHDLPSDAEKELHAAAELGDMGAQWVLVKDRIETFLVLLITGVMWLLVGQ